MGAPDPLLLSFLSIHDAPCPVCSYNLRSLNADVCPECGAPLHLQVGSENLRLGPWFVGVVSLALGMGFDGVVGLLMSVAFTGMALFGQSVSPLDLMRVGGVLAGFLTLAGLCGLALHRMFSRRSAWNRMPRKRQKRAAAALFAGTFLVHALYGVAVMLWMNL